MKDWAGEDQDMSTDTEVAGTVRQLQVGDPVASASLQEAVCDMLVPATAPQPEEQEYYYNSDDLVLNLDAEFPDLAEQSVEWQMARRVGNALKAGNALRAGCIARAGNALRAGHIAKAGHTVNMMRGSRGCGRHAGSKVKAKGALRKRTNHISCKVHQRLLVFWEMFFLDVYLVLSQKFYYVEVF